jgi:Zn-dependent peptidase ImmA (M78 family)/transcriptional regulator with XRE-family HTH domain
MNSKEVFGNRVKAARRMANLSMAELAEKMEKTVKKQSISKYEKGEMLPTSENLIILSRALNVPIDYFFKNNIIQLGNIEFRKKARIGKKEYLSIVEKVRDRIEKYLELERLVHIQSSFQNPLNHNVVNSKMDIEKAVIELRKEWQLGLSSPIPRVIELLEKHRFKIIEVDVSSDFDGMSTIIQDIPIIVVNRNFNNIRKRFTALHEMAHLIFRFPGSLEPKGVERLCHFFAGAFLIPRQTFIEEFQDERSRISMLELVQIKYAYGLSIQAIMARAKDLNIITENRYRQFCIHFNKAGYRKKEPGHYPIKEISNRFDLLIHKALSEEIISFSKASALSGKSIDELYKEFNI